MDASSSRTPERGVSESTDSTNQCCGSMKFWYGSGSGSAVQYLGLMDPDPAIFASDLQDVNKIFFCFLLFEGTFTSFFKDKKS
jgi:hypothetical protein